MPLFFFHAFELEIDPIELVGGKIINIEPIIIPGSGLCFLHLVLKLLVGELRVVAETDIVAAFDYGLAFAEYGKVAVKTVPYSELLSCTHNIQVLAVSDEDAGLACADEYITKLAFVDVDAGCCVEEENVALFAI